jgi:hypothetical protein
MANLSQNWITEHLMDFEYKKYVLLGYLKQVQEHFKEQKLYPDLPELIGHYKNLIQLKNNATNLENNFKKSIKSIDLENLKFIYEHNNETESLNELKQIIEYSEPLMAGELNKGKNIFDFAEQNILVDHIGILPIYKKEGYFILHPFESKNIAVYHYSFSKVTLLEQEVYGLHSTYFSSYTITLSKPVDKIKQDIIYQNPQLPNPPVYLFKAKTILPNDETFLPIAKRLLYRNLLNYSA